MNILITMDNKYLHQVLVMLTSLIDSNPNETFDVYLLHSSISDDYIENIKNTFDESVCRFHVKEIDDEKILNLPTTKKYPNSEVYYRLFAPEYLPKEIDRILYLDPDLVIINSLDELYNIDFKGNLFVGSTHIAGVVKLFNILKGNIKLKNKYINTGVMMINLEALRKENNTEKIFDYLYNTRKILILPDQDVLSAVYGHKIILIDTMVYNLSDRILKDRILSFIHAYPHKDPKKNNINWIDKNSIIIHFCGTNKPWNEDYKGKLGKYYKKYDDMLNKKTGMSL